MKTITSATPVLVVGAGIMGTGIVQVAALAGHPVQLFDARPGAAGDAVTALAATFKGLVAKGRLREDEATDALGRITPVAQLSNAAQAGLVIEAIVEDLQLKRALLQQLETIVGADCVLASNTSSISITALANGLAQPQRLVGMHFFNPVPLMKLVEVVSGLHTSPHIAEAIVELSCKWGKVPVQTRSTPGFIVNRIARPFYAEALALLQERAAAPEVIDACLRGAGFRMGPCELMDLIGHDTNFAVTRSVYEANFFDKRYVPSLVQRELVDAGFLGRKSGRGFYSYPDGAPTPSAGHHAPPQGGLPCTLHGQGRLADELAARLKRAFGDEGRAIRREPASDWVGLQVGSARLVATDGRRADALARGWNVADVAVFDWPLGDGASAVALAYSIAGRSSDDWQAQAPRWLRALGFEPHCVADTPGLVVARTVAMLVNEGADAVLQGVCTAQAADAAMKLGVNYPAGPFDWLRRWGARAVGDVLEQLDGLYRGDRYRVSPWLEREHAPAEEARHA